MLSPSLLVTIAAHGVSIPACGDHPSWPLGPAELDLLLALRAPESHADLDGAVAATLARHPGADAGLHALLAHLTAIGRLRAPSALPSLLVSGTTGDTTGDTTADPTGDPTPADPTGELPPGALVVGTPVQLVIADGRFWLVDPDGRARVGLTAVELLAVGELRWPLTVADWFAQQSRLLGDDALTEPELGAVARDLIAHGMATEVDDHDLAAAQGRDRQLGSQELTRLRTLMDVCSAQADERAARRRAERASRAPGQQPKPFVVPYNKVRESAPLALGMVLANAMAHDGGRLHDTYDFEPNWVARKSALRQLARQAPVVALFSNYTWSHGDNLVASAALKDRSPDSVTVHGGPDVPSREHDAVQYLAEHPHIDVLVRGEGELTLAELLEAMGGRLAGRKGRLPDLDGVAGITYRDGDRVVRGPDRERIADLDSLPSPYLSGVFEPFAQATASVIILETNRGCPYGCTFCDWGSATQSRIRKFSQERVFAELEWAASHRMPMVFVADANFGILPRDPEIADEVARLKRKYGYPLHFTTNYAKNTTANLERIVHTMVDAGVITEGTLSLQSTDPNTLKTIKRSNIKVQEYNKLAVTFRNAGLPLWVDIMMGLPGSDRTSFRHDLQHVIDSELCAKISRTELLVNSPMNAPDYKARHQIDTEPMTGDNLKVRRPLLVSTATYTRADFDVMERLRRLHLVAENYGTLRFAARFVRQETGVEESEVYERIDLALQDDPDRYPFLAWATLTLNDMLVAPASWQLYYADLGRLLVDHLGVADDSALRAVLRAQRALMPERGRSFPDHVELEHDFGAWFLDVLDAKSADPLGDWCATVPRLGSYGPAVFLVDDPTGVCRTGLGHRVTSDPHGNWELSSAVARAVPRRHLLVEH